jgi:hypothetical protein
MSRALSVGPLDMDWRHNCELAVLPSGIGAADKAKNEHPGSLSLYGLRREKQGLETALHKIWAIKQNSPNVSDEMIQKMCEHEKKRPAAKKHRPPSQDLAQS